MTHSQEVPDSQSYRTRFNELDKTYSPSESANGSAPNGPAGQFFGEGRALPQVKGPLQGEPWRGREDQPGSTSGSGPADPHEGNVEPQDAPLSLDRKEVHQPGSYSGSGPADPHEGNVERPG